MRSRRHALRTAVYALLACGLLGSLGSLGACDEFGTAPAADAGSSTDGQAGFDAAGPDAGDATADAGRLTPPCGDGGARVFVTSGLFLANFASGEQNATVAADGICRVAAEAAGLSGRYVAWLAYDGHPATMPPAAFYVSTTCEVLIAGGSSDFSRGPLRNAIDRVETGKDVDSLVDGGATHTVWTGASPNGNATTDHCVSWRTNGTARATTGDCKKKGAEWSNDENFGFATCDSSGRLYCFEVLP